MSTILDRIVVAKRRELDELKGQLPLEQLRTMCDKRKEHLFVKALSTGKGTHIIAELKKSSPSRGVLREDFDVASLAQLYRDGGASALSVLTERDFFDGSFENLEKARETSGLPVLCKDFIFDPYQVYYACWRKADAILLIVALLGSEPLNRLLSLAGGLGLDCLVEVHDEKELTVALDCGAKIVGVNNRNLQDFSVSLAISEQLAPLIPADVVKVAESGIFEQRDIARLSKAGYNCFLIGEALVRSDDPVALLRSLRGQ